MNALYNASIKAPSSKGLAPFAIPEAKSSKTGVSVRFVRNCQLRQRHQAARMSDRTMAESLAIFFTGISQSFLQI
jgi:hypothetical protein